MPLYKETARDVYLKAGSKGVALHCDPLVKRGFEQPQWYLDKRSFNIRIRAETVKQFLGDLKFENMLDIGCGDGSISVPLLTPNNRLTLLDMSETMLSIARSRIPSELASQVQLVNDHFMQARLAPRSYELIICCGVLAYVDDTRSFVEKLLSLLKPGGSVIIECTDSSHPVSYLGRLVGRTRSLIIPPKFPLVLHSSSDVIRTFTRLGFRRCGAFRYSLPPPGVRTLLSQDSLYKTVRAGFGTPSHNRFPWLGDECIYHFKHADSKGERVVGSESRALAVKD